MIFRCIFRRFFLFFKNFDFLGQKLGKRHKWPKMTCNAIHIIFYELNIMWLWFLVHWCKMMISPSLFFIFQKFWFSGPKSVVRAKRANSLYLCVHHFLVTICHTSIIFGTLMQNDELCRSLSYIYQIVDLLGNLIR